MYWHSDTPNRTGIYGAGMALAFGINFNNLHNSWGNMKFNNQADILLDAEIALGHNSFNLRYAIADNPWYYIIKPGDTYYGIANRMLNGTVISDQRQAWNPHQLATNLQIGEAIFINDPNNIFYQGQSWWSRYKSRQRQRVGERLEALASAEIGIFSFASSLNKTPIDPFPLPIFKINEYYLNWIFDKNQNGDGKGG
jgi:hypothetical protein